jgi:hypothetical protein
MIRSVQDRYLPPDHNAFVAGEPPTGRVLRHRADACPPAKPSKSRSASPRNLLGADARRTRARTGAQRKGFGIVAGTGTGKTLAVRPIAVRDCAAPLKIGVVTANSEATPYCPT